MPLSANLPSARQSLIEAGGTTSRPFYVFFQSVATTIDALSAQVGDVTTTPAPSITANVTGAFSIYTQGTLQGGIVRVSLQGDVDTPGVTQYYGSDGTGVRGWFNVSDALAGSANVTLTVGTDGVTTFDLSANVLASLALADTAVQPGDLAAVATSGAYSDLSGLPTLGTAAATDATDYATAAQGALADTALQDAPSDGQQYARKDAAWVVVSGGSGSGDVVGPASAVDSDVALFDGATGKLLKDGGSFGSLVRAAVLTGLSTATSAVIAATDTVLSALGKLQAQITDNLLPKGYINGLQVQWVSGTALTITSGAAYIEGSGKVLRATSAIAKTGLSLTASTWYHVYLYDNAGTPAVEVVTTAPAAPYSGTARSKTGDTSRRYVGSVKTDASGGIYNFLTAGQQIAYRNSQDIAPFRVLSNGLATSETSVSMAAVVPTTSRLVVLRGSNTSTTNRAKVGTSDDSVTLDAFHAIVTVNENTGIFTPFPCDSSQAITYLLDGSSASGFYVDVYGYLFER